MSRQYFQDITNVPELIPELANMVSDYTGGYCDSKTQGGTTCWLNHQGCDEYCLGNLEGWLKPKFMALLGKPLTSQDDGEVLERYSNLLGTVEYLTFPPLIYHTWNTWLLLHINHPTIGIFSFSFTIQTTRVNNKKYSKQIFVDSSSTLPNLVQKYVSRLQEMDTVYELQYNNIDQWEFLVQSFTKIYQDLENLLYYNNTIPLAMVSSFKIYCGFHEHAMYDDNDRFVDLRLQAMNYLFHSPKEEKTYMLGKSSDSEMIFEDESELPDYTPIKQVLMRDLNKKAQQFKYAFNTFDFGELTPNIQVDDYRGYSYTVSFTSMTGIKYEPI